MPMYTYALLDTAPIEGWHLKLDQRGIAFASLFEGQPEAAFIEIAPLLIPFDGLAESNAHLLRKELTRLGVKHPALHWLQSRHSLEELAARLRQFHTIDLANGKTLLLRWYDTRVLPEWLALLTEAQCHQFLAGIGQWHYLDRAGKQRELPCSAADLPLAPARIALNAGQTSQLLRIGEADALILELRRVIPAELAQVKPPALHAFVQDQLVKAQAQGLQSPMQQITWLLLALHTGGSFTETAAGIRLLASLPQQADNFETHAETLPETVWQSGRPLWEQPNRL